MNAQHDVTLRKFIPLIVIFLCITLYTLGNQFIKGPNILEGMYDFMGSFFIVFSVFKIINLSGFAQAYSKYDIIAKRSLIYSYAYPFIELFLGFLYLLRYHITIANYITIILMFVSSIGVGLELSQGKKIVCACLGTVFKIPMTYVTLAEDIIMGLMACIMLIQSY